MGKTALMGSPVVFPVRSPASSYDGALEVLVDHLGRLLEAAAMSHVVMGDLVGGGDPHPCRGSAYPPAGKARKFTISEGGLVANLRRKSSWRVDEPEVHPGWMVNDRTTGTTANLTWGRGGCPLRIGATGYRCALRLALRSGASNALVESTNTKIQRLTTRVASASVRRGPVAMAVLAIGGCCPDCLVGADPSSTETSTADVNGRRRRPMSTADVEAVSRRGNGQAGGSPPEQGMQDKVQASTRRRPAPSPCRSHCRQRALTGM